MKKSIIVLSVLFTIFLSHLVLASDVAYILKNPRRVDSGFMSAFNEMGLDVDLIRNTEIYSVDFSEYKFIFVGDERFRNSKDIPVNDYPSVIANGYYGKKFGLTNRGGISKLTSNSQLKIKKDSIIIQVYDKSTFKLGGVGVPYYYLSNRYKEENMETIATTSIGYDKELGDVISYSTQGANKCFFGITKTKFWTKDAKELFKGCVKSVIGEIEESFCGDDDCDEGEDYLNCPEDCEEGVSVCGNNILETGEECDDGNLIDGDSCDSNCKIEGEGSYCGDGTCNGKETCESCEIDCGMCETINIKINEFVSDPLTGDNDWIELYNPTEDIVDLTGWTINDGASWIKILSGNINAMDFFIIPSSNKLNKGGDLIELKNPSEVLIDKVAYGNWDDGNTTDNAPVPDKGESCGRFPNGTDTDTDNVDFVVF